MTLPKGDRDAVARAVQRLRKLFEEEFAQQAIGRFGFHTVAPFVEPIEALTLTRSQEYQRDELLGAIDYLRCGGLGEGQAIAELIREAAFTAINQLLAIRVAEAIGVLPEVTARGRQSAGYRDVIHDLFPLLTQQDDEGLWAYIQACGDELGATVPLLFDRRLPTAAFVPGRPCVDTAITIINDPGAAAAWSDPEALAWAYQFFNRDDERQWMRAESAAPRDSRELAVRNQFCTPWYVVDWLVQNTLGRRLREAGIELELPLLVGELGVEAPLALEDVRVLDPAVGSGNFLLGCYDLLEQAWRTQKLSAEDAAPRILRCLHGIDIDPRASQIAQTVLVLRARKAAPQADLQPPTITTARSMQTTPDGRRDVFARLSRKQRELFEEVAEALEQAPTLGSLLDFEQTTDEDLSATIEAIVARTDARPASRMFAAEVSDALRFVQLCKQRYDVVLMNPPFGSGVPGTDKYLRTTYGTSSIDLYAASVQRGIKLLNEHGKLGAITSRSGFFLTTFEEWRRRLVLPRLLGLLDLGMGVMRDAMVEAAAYVLSARLQHGRAIFRRLLDAPDKSIATYARSDDRFVRRPTTFTYIPGSPVAYWLRPELLEIFRTCPSLEGSPSVDVRRGAYTGDDFRYLRCWWEVSTSGGLGSSRRWVTFTKGGEYSPYYSDTHLVVDWDYRRGTFRDFYGRKGRPTALPENRGYFGRPGLTWSLRSQKGFSVRPVPAGAVFGHKGPMIFVSTDAPADLNQLMAYLNSRLAAALLEAMVAFGSYEVGTVQRLPSISPGGNAAHCANELTAMRMSEGERVETDHLFLSPWTKSVSDAARASRCSREIDRMVSLAAAEESGAEPLSATYPSRWFEKDHNLPSASTAHHELSYLLGAALGRWDIRIPLGIIDPPSLPGPYEPLPPVSRGMLVGPDGLPAQELPTGYPIGLPSQRILHDEPGHSWDVLVALEGVIKLFEAASEAPDLILRREITDLRFYLRTSFIANHLKDYSASRRYGSIYWYLSVPSKEWGLWVYAPALSRETLFAIVGAARDKLRRTREQAAQLRKRDGSSADRNTIERIERVERLADEIRSFTEHADKVAQSGWQPDLNDGMVLCAAPLEPLFADDAWRKRVAQYRKDLEQNKYPWASVQREYYGGEV